jgi:AraC family ethanolamine operon transcriptional activator
VELYRFNDIDALGEHLSGWKIEPVQLSAGELDLTLATLKMSDIAVSAIACNRLVADRAGIDPNWLQVVLLLAPQRWNGYEAPPSSLVLLAPGSDHRDVVPEGFRCVELAVAAELAGAVGLDRWLTVRGDEAIYPLREPTTRIAAGWIHSLLAPEATNPLLDVALKGGVAVRERAIELLLYLSGASASTARAAAPEPVAKRLARYDLTCAALAIIDSMEVDADLTVAQLAHRVGVTGRTLQMAFHDVLGVSPSRYRLARRLHAARQQLGRGQAPSVTDAALGVGFDHLSRFARHYRTLFGEPPSQTLRRARALRTA